MEEEEQKTLVVVYDWCIPRSQFQRIVPSRVVFAEHIFACVAIKNNVIRRNDPIFFSYVADVFGNLYPQSTIVIVTQDQGFLGEVKNNEAYREGRVHVFTISPCNSDHMNSHRACEVAEELIRRYGSLQKNG